MVRLPASWTTVTPLSKGIAIAIFIIFPFVGFYLGIQYQKHVQPSASPTAIANNVAKNGCAEVVIPKYEAAAEFPADLRGDRHPELVRLYTQPSASSYPEHVAPLYLKVFSYSSDKGCYLELLSQSFAANELQGYKRLNNFFGDQKDVVMFIPQSTGYGSGYTSIMQFLVYVNGSFQVVPGPQLTELSSYQFDGENLLVATAIWDGNSEGHFDSHKYQLDKYSWAGSSYYKAASATTAGKHPSDIRQILSSEPSLLQ